MENVPPPPGSDVRPQATETRPRPDHERRDASIRGILIFAVALTVVAVVVQFALGAWMRGFENEERKVASRRPDLFDDLVGQYPGPQLQHNPALGTEALYRKQQAQLDSYGWVAPGKVARIPIARAVDLLAGRGLPKSPPPAAGSPEGPAPADEPSPAPDSRPAAPSPREGSPAPGDPE